MSSQEVNAEQRLFVASFTAGEGMMERSKRRLRHDETPVN